MAQKELNVGPKAPIKEYIKNYVKNTLADPIRDHVRDVDATIHGPFS